MLSELQAAVCFVVVFFHFVVSVDGRGVLAACSDEKLKIMCGWRQARKAKTNGASLGLVPHAGLWKSK